MKKHLCILTVSLLGLVVAGCARFHSTVTEVTDPSKGLTTKTTEVSAGTLFDANSELAKLSSGQTDKSQKIAIGALNQESSGSNVATFAESIVGAAVKAAVESRVPPKP